MPVRVGMPYSVQSSTAPGAVCNQLHPQDRQPTAPAASSSSGNPLLGAPTPTSEQERSRFSPGPSKIVSEAVMEAHKPQQPQCRAPPRQLLQHNHHIALGSYEAAVGRLPNGRQRMKSKKKCATELDRPAEELSCALLHQTASPGPRATHGSHPDALSGLTQPHKHVPAGSGTAYTRTQAVCKSASQHRGAQGLTGPRSGSVAAG